MARLPHALLFGLAVHHDAAGPGIGFGFDCEHGAHGFLVAAASAIELQALCPHAVARAGVASRAGAGRSSCREQFGCVIHFRIISNTCSVAAMQIASCPGS